MGRAWNFQASGGLGLLCIRPWAGRAFLYQASGFSKVWNLPKLQEKSQNIFFKFFSSLFCPMFGRNFCQNSAVFRPRPKPKVKKIAQKMSNFLPKFGRKLTQNRPISGLKKAHQAFRLWWSGFGQASGLARGPAHHYILPNHGIYTQIFSLIDFKLLYMNDN